MEWGGGGGGWGPFGLGGGDSVAHVMEQEVRSCFGVHLWVTYDEERLSDKHTAALLKDYTIKIVK